MEVEEFCTFDEEVIKDLYYQPKAKSQKVMLQNSSYSNPIEN